jgi:toxin-antitoxin system PIN domain toxin
MMLLDVNVLVDAFRTRQPRHEGVRRWLEARINAPEPLGLCDIVLSGFVRVVTHPRVFVEPDTIADALTFARTLRSLPQAVIVAPGPRHWAIFEDLCVRTGAVGNAVPDAFLAALSIESGSEWISGDRGFARYPGLRWRDPIDE